MSGEGAVIDRLITVAKPLVEFGLDPVSAISFATQIISASDNTTALLNENLKLKKQVRALQDGKVIIENEQG